MNAFTRYMSTAAIGLALALPGAATYAKTPANMLVIAQRIDDMITLDPAESYELSSGDLTRNVYDKLVAFDPADLKAGYKPSLATKWDVSKDGKTITFTIRKDVKFHSGNAVTPEAVAWSLQRAVILNKTPSFILTQFGFTKDNVKDMIKVVGDDQVSITTDKQYATSFVLNCLTATVASIVDEKLLMSHDKDGDMGNAWLKTNDAGSGPYKLVTWKPNDSYVLQAADGYWGKAPAMKRVVVRHVQESSTQRLMLEKGDIDIARNLNPEDVAGIKDDKGLKVHTELKGTLMYLSFGQQNETLAKPGVTEALKYLVDYKGMVNSFLKGQWQIHQSFLPATFLGAIDDNPYHLDEAKAKKMLADAGVKDVTLHIGVRDQQDRLEIAQSLQNTFGKAGITVKLDVGTGKQVLTKYRARSLDMYLGTWGPDYPDPQTNAGTYAWNPTNTMEAKLTGSLAWRNSWDAGKFNKMVDEAVVEPDRAKRAKMYEDMQREWMKVAPFAILFQKIEQDGVAKDVQHFNVGGAITAASYYQVTK
ncbi:ABC transporter substrate-binding protein [Acidimangrovimonas sediminis]|uniref:ABC transporter substrate-binding protein n=1 Tax=Acidimangrovimonas sediminis TaxID=2056283 RepID=UPI000C808F4E|nr:ABC transporter substrate-binding protein [Acidimangrovimonas sediminis]